MDKDALVKALITRTRQTPEGPIVSPLDVKAATENRDSLAKILYSKVCVCVCICMSDCLASFWPASISSNAHFVIKQTNQTSDATQMFDWLVACINAAIGEDKNCAASVGVLDIYGFESFASNDFEQVSD